MRRVWCGKRLAGIGAWHTLAESAAFDSQRRELTDAIGQSLSLPTVIGALLDDSIKKNAILEFCDKVIGIKEEDKRNRKREDAAIYELTQDRDCPVSLDNSKN